MGNKFASGKKALAECDRCGFRYLLKDLKKLTIKTKQVNLKVCKSCWEADHPQLLLGLYPVSDPQAIREPRTDSAGYPQSRALVTPAGTVVTTGFVGNVVVTTV